MRLVNLDADFGLQISDWKGAMAFRGRAQGPCGPRGLPPILQSEICNLKSAISFIVGYDSVR